MGTHPYRDVAIAAVHNTKQGKTLEGYDSLGIALEERARPEPSTGDPHDRSQEGHRDTRPRSRTYRGTIRPDAVLVVTR